MSIASKDAPAFDFYPERWLAGVADLTDAEQISYLRLLCHQWLRQGLPEDAEKLRRLAGKGVTEELLAKFPVDVDGLRRNKRLEVIRTEQRERIARKSEQRRNAALKRWHNGSNADGDTEAMRPHSGSNAHHPPPTTHPKVPEPHTPAASAPPPLESVVDSQPPEQEETYTPAFEQFWAAYPNKKGKGAAFKAFKRIKGLNLPLLLQAIANQKKGADWLKDGGQYIPHPSTWITGRHWHDEVKPAASAKPKIQLAC